MHLENCSGNEMYMKVNNIDLLLKNKLIIYNVLCNECKNSHGMRDMKCIIHEHDMPTCLFSNYYMWSACSLTN